MVMIQEGGVCCQILVFVHICKSPQLSASKATASLRRALAKQTSLCLLFGQRIKPMTLLQQILSSACKGFAVILQWCQVQHHFQPGKWSVAFQKGVTGNQYNFCPRRCASHAKTRCGVYASALIIWNSQRPSCPLAKQGHIPYPYSFIAECCFLSVRKICFAF